jgi:hypothetical protein
MKNLEESISSSCEKEHGENSSKEHCDLWFGLVKNTILNTGLVLRCGCRLVKPR